MHRVLREAECNEHEQQNMKREKKKKIILEIECVFFYDIYDRCVHFFYEGKLSMGNRESWGEENPYDSREKGCERYELV